MALHRDELRIAQGRGHDVLAIDETPLREPSGPVAARLLAIGLATVDHERLAGELGLGTALEAAAEPALGASTWLVPGTRLVLLEPSTEGRLAAALARHGEGPIALYLGLDGRTDLELGRGPAPLLLEPSAVSGPFVLILTRSRGG